MKRFALALSAIVAGLVVSSCAVGVGQSATNITKLSARLNGKVLSTTGGPGSWYFEYGLTRARTEKTLSLGIAFTANTIHSVSEPVDGLEPGRTYHYAVCAADSQNAGHPICSSQDQTFTTEAGPALSCQPGILFPITSSAVTSDSENVTCTALGGRVTIGDVQVGSSTPEFFSASSGCDNRTLEPGASCTIVVTFEGAPPVTQDYDAVVVIPNDASDLADVVQVWAINFN